MQINEIVSSNRTFIMGCAMGAILLFHQPFFSDNLLTGFFHIFGHWGVDLFLFISGMGIVNSLSKNTLKQYYTNRIIRIIPSCFIVGVCKVVLFHWGFVEFVHENTLLTLTNCYLWYIYAILIYYIFAPFLFKAIQKHGILVLVVVSLLSISCMFVPFYNNSLYFINKMGWVIERLPVFVYGMYFSCYSIKKEINEYLKIGFISLLICFILRLCVVYLNWLINSVIYILLLLSMPTLCVISSFFYIALKRFKGDILFKYLGRYSLEIYLWQEFVFYNMSSNQLFLYNGKWFQFFISLALILILSYLTFVLKEVLFRTVKSIYKKQYL